MTQERITFQTSDGVTIVGDWAKPDNAKKAALLLHMMPASRQSFEPLSKELNKIGIATLAIDLRGHGESVEQSGKQLDYKNFSDSDHQASRLDVDGALNFLKSKGFNENAIAAIGASIGANLALDAMQRYSGIARGVLLSPGFDYRGVKTTPAMKGLLPTQKVWIFAAEGDAYSADSSVKLQQMQKETATVTIFGNGAHGTNLFKQEKNLIPNIIKFLQDF